MKVITNFVFSRAICFYSGFYFMMRTVALWLDSEENEVISSQEYISTLGDHFYYLSDAVLIGLVGLFIFNKSEKSVVALFSLLYILGLSSCQMLDEFMDIVNYDAKAISNYLIEGEGQLTFKTFFVFMPTLLKIWVILEIYIAIFKKRYDWKCLTSVPYDPQKVQAIYSKPDSILTLLGVTVSLCPKLAVRFCYGGKTIRFKRNSPFPILVDTVIQAGDIIENTDHTGDYFHNRWDYVKGKRYNLFSFNCRSLMINRVQNKVKINK